jgi:hypothetical protein
MGTRLALEVYMLGINWSDQQTFWLNAANIGLGVVTLFCFVALGYGVARDMLARSKKRAVEQVREHEESGVATGFGSHSFEMPGLGLTMADGGEPAAQPPKAADEAARKPHQRAE